MEHRRYITLASWSKDHITGQASEDAEARLGARFVSLASWAAARAELLEFASEASSDGSAWTPAAPDLVADAGLAAA